MSFSPTDKQRSAILNMENYLGLDENRIDFDHREDFQTYFEAIKAKADKKTKQRERSHKKKLSPAFDSSYQLSAYAKKYVAKYHPSQKKLQQKLMEKSGRNEELVDEVFQANFSQRSEKPIIEHWILHFMEAGLNQSQIKQKLFSKLFARENIDHMMQQYCPDGESLLDPERVALDVEKYQKKGLSPQQIQMKLSASSEDRRIVAEVLEEHYHEDEQLDNLKGWIDKFRKQNLDEKKLIQRLMRRGFRYDLIKKGLEEA